MIKHLLKRGWWNNITPVLVAIMLLPMHLSARDFTNNDISYSVLDEDAKTVMIKEASVSGDLVIPSKVTDSGTEYTVTAIGESAFTGAVLTTVEFPTTLKSIGAHAFENQKELYYLEFPEGLEEIGDYAFYYCQLLQFPAFPESLVKIGKWAFVHCDSQLSITLPRKIQSLGEAAFKSMYKLRKAVLFSDLEELPNRLFTTCMCLEEVYLPQRLKVIGDEAFKWHHLEEVILPKTVEKIGVSAFEGDDRSGIWTNGEWVIECKLSKINFSENLREIGDKAFYRQPIRNVELSEGLLKIGNQAFYDNSELSTLSLPSSLEEIGYGAFAINPESSPTLSLLGNVTLPSVKKLGEGVFYSRPIGSLNIGDGITELTISPENLYYAENIGLPKVLTLGVNLNSLSPKAIFPNKDLRVLQLKSSTPPRVSESFPLTENEIDNMLVIVKDGTKELYLRNPYWKAFSSSMVEESEADVSIYVDGQYPISEEIRVQAGLMPSQVVKMKVNGKLADSDWRLIRENMYSLISLDLSGISNTEIPDGALKGMTLLANISLPSKLIKIGHNAFEGCKLIDMNSIPESVETIGNAAFKDCEMLSITKLPDALVRFEGAYVFMNCKSLRELTAGENLEDIHSYAGGYAFADCTSLNYVDFSNTKLKVINTEAFKGCSNLTQILLPESLEEIGSGAFEDTALESVDLPDNLVSIGPKAFSGTKLRAVTIPNGTQTLSEQAFANTVKLVNINLPKTMKSLGNSAFANSMKLSAISCQAIDAPEAVDGAFNDMNRKKCGLTVPQQSFRSYLNAPGWGGFQNILNRLEVECPDEAVEITAIDEEEYQEITEEEQLQQEAENSAGEDTENEDPEQPTPQMMRAKARQQLSQGKNYALLFNGATVATPNTTKGTRIFINPKKEGELIGVYYNDVDITDQMVGNSYLLPIKANGKLAVKFNSAAIDNIVYDNIQDATCTAYDFMGRIVYTGNRSQLDSSVNPGIYIVKTGNKTEKIYIR